MTSNTVNGRGFPLGYVRAGLVRVDKQNRPPEALLLDYLLGSTDESQTSEKLGSKRTFKYFLHTIGLKRAIKHELSKECNLFMQI